ncbi:fatty acid desaturase [Acidithiobacillus caldus]
MSDTPSHHDWETLHSVKLQDLRSTISPERYRRSSARALLWYGIDGSLYLLSIAGALLLPWWWAQILCGLVAGSAVAFMFVWAHDAAHGALFQSKRVSEILGTLFMLPSLNMYRLWAFGHNRVHHGFTSLVSLDWIWRPWTPAEYRAKSSWQRLLYRLERSPYGCALHYLLRVWWPGMVRFRADPKSRDKGAFFLAKMSTLLFFLLFSAVALVLSGWLGWFAAIALPFLVFNYYIALFVFLHHTHPDLPFFTDKEEWSQSIGQMYCSTVVRCSALSEALIHGILIHAPHHVDPRIPFYHLRGAYDDLRKHYAAYLHESRFSFALVRRIFRQCQLYDYENKRWLSFRSLRQSVLTPGLAEEPRVGVATNLH